MKLPEFLRFTRMERGGIVVLLCISVCYLFWRASLLEESESVIDPVSVQKLEQVDHELEENTSDGKYAVTDHLSEKNRTLFTAPEKPFHPDTITTSEWESMGLSSKQAMALVNYGRSIGGFSNAAEFRKSFVVSDEFFNAVEKTIQFPVSNLKEKKGSKEPEGHSIEFPLDINTASQSELQALPGIGKVYSERILKYRQVLGGFYSVHQLNEVYGLEDSTVQQLMQIITVDGNVRRLSVNKASEEELYTHPYFREDGLASEIVKEREEHGPFRSVEDIRRVFLVDEQIYGKIVNYLKVDND